MSDTIVIDLDGTLADISARLPLIQCDNPDYDSFYMSVGSDKLNAWCANLMQVYWSQGYEVAIVSARRRSSEILTREWLEEHKVYYTQLHLLRPMDDSTSDVELKMKWAQSYGIQNILFVVDDRQKVVDAWRAAGITCLQCNTWIEKGVVKNEVGVLTDLVLSLRRQYGKHSTQRCGNEGVELCLVCNAEKGLAEAIRIQEGE